MAKRILLVAGLFVVSWACGQDDGNPFKTPAPKVNVEQTITEAPITSLDSFQFNGMMKMNGKVRISVYDTKEKKNFWLTEGEVGELGLTFQRFDEKNESVVIVQGGINKRLNLNKVKIEALKIAPATATTNAVPAVTTARPQGPENVESDEEARARIQRVAEEIRRRRAERRARLEERQSGGSN